MPSLFSEVLLLRCAVAAAPSAMGAAATGGGGAATAAADDDEDAAGPVGAVARNARALRGWIEVRACDIYTYMYTII